jgi:hypothetical protein
MDCITLRRSGPVINAIISTPWLDQLQIRLKCWSGAGTAWSLGEASGTTGADASFENWNHRRTTPHCLQVRDLDFAREDEDERHDLR